MSCFIFVPQEDELNQLEQSYLNEDLEDSCPSAGFDNIKKFVMSSFIFVSQEDEINQLEQSYLNEDLKDTCPSAGFDNIKKFVNV